MSNGTPMYFAPHPEDVARAKASNCAMATPKDPRDCHPNCWRWDSRTNGTGCPNYRHQQPKT